MKDLNYLVYFLALGFLEMDQERGTFSFVSICTSVFFYKHALLLKIKYKLLKFAS